MIRVVIDTSLMASGVANRRGVPGLIIDAWQAGQFEVAVAKHLVQELEETLPGSVFSRKAH